MSTQTSPSPAGGNGHNVSFDGRLFVITRGSMAGVGWHATVLRPQSVTTASGFPDVSQAFAPFVLVQADTNHENGIALCEETPQPTKCDAAGTASATGDHACYELVVFDSDALATPPANVMRRRRLKVVVSQPDTALAAIASHQWTDASLTPLSTTLRGIEPTVSKDGQLLVWQGHPDNDGKIDTLVYSSNPAACGSSGWSTPKSLSSMNGDASVKGKYKLADKPLRAADGTVFISGQRVYGAYPWLFPDGEAVSFTAVGMPCRAVEDPPGCGPRRNALSVLGYPTQWTISHIDGDVNPDTDQTVRLFFSSPGPKSAAPLPVSKGLDVWPFFGSNTSNYTELIFDDGLDGQYAAVWHLNELVKADGSFDLKRTADSSGYANTGTLLGGASYPAKNNGLVGKAVILNGTDGRIEIPNANSLQPVNQLTMELAVKLAVDPDCDGKNNNRTLLQKGPVGQGSFSVVLEEDRSIRARVRVLGGGQYELHAPVQLPVGAWSTIAAEYDGATGTMAVWVDAQEVSRTTYPAAPLDSLFEPVVIGGPGTARPACPDGNGSFAGVIDEVKISRVWRYGDLPPAPDMAVEPPDGVVDPGADASASVPLDGGLGDGGPVPDPASPDGGCSISQGAPKAMLTALLALAIILLVRRRRA